MSHVMLILTDGTIHDMNETKDLIVELSQYPVSLIIIGVGKEQFENMIILDGDTEELRNSQNKKTERDIV